VTFASPIADLDPPHEALQLIVAWLVATGLVGLVSLLVLRGLAAWRNAPRKGSVSWKSTVHSPRDGVCLPSPWFSREKPMTLTPHAFSTQLLAFSFDDGAKRGAVGGWVRPRLRGCSGCRS
jgi:hypothetical protein